MGSIAFSETAKRLPTHTRYKDYNMDTNGLVAPGTVDIADDASAQGILVISHTITATLVPLAAIILFVSNLHHRQQKRYRHCHSTHHMHAPLHSPPSSANTTGAFPVDERNLDATKTIYTLSDLAGSQSSSALGAETIVVRASSNTSARNDAKYHLAPSLDSRRFPSLRSNPSLSGSQAALLRQQPWTGSIRSSGDAYGSPVPSPVPTLESSFAQQQQTHLGHLLASSQVKQYSHLPTGGTAGAAHVYPHIRLPGSSASSSAASHPSLLFWFEPLFVLLGMTLHGSVGFLYLTLDLSSESVPAILELSSWACHVVLLGITAWDCVTSALLRNFSASLCSVAGIWQAPRYECSLRRRIARWVMGFLLASLGLASLALHTHVLFKARGAAVADTLAVEFDPKPRLDTIAAARELQLDVIIMSTVKCAFAFLVIVCVCLKLWANVINDTQTPSFAIKQMALSEKSKFGPDRWHDRLRYPHKGPEAHDLSVLPIAVMIIVTIAISLSTNELSPRAPRTFFFTLPSPRAHLILSGLVWLIWMLSSFMLFAPAEDPHNEHLHLARRRLPGASFHEAKSRQVTPPTLVQVTVARPKSLPATRTMSTRYSTPPVADQVDVARSVSVRSCSTVASGSVRTIHTERLSRISRASWPAMQLPVIEPLSFGSDKLTLGKRSMSIRDQSLEQQRSRIDPTPEAMAAAMEALGWRPWEQQRASVEPLEAGLVVDVSEQCKTSEQEGRGADSPDDIIVFDCQDSEAGNRAFLHYSASRDDRFQIPLLPRPSSTAIVKHLSRGSFSDIRFVQVDSPAGNSQKAALSHKQKKSQET
ncbi:uncharacterized protein L969DRAFT_91346 [Mixia osmundae IAM 14324]|uniref:Uncharacterized protein n=1 Tax=Mixia osmundae (strain CBS 9802 / IAM 14324 / JCM 22182 / KY 12970) TaxID=764103 RepID=G7E3R1_MIXOS|nr:uncharacterized protein L969DRAFT_91346 [Mixia osmundae IAM 14324]KEI41869.1 hypothetical protein L969DRAFT_91346 [Mixia osmundae IAM 14324]GAA97471.1 hypothetical protein E5Q_04150 [Mixia osmundae IAM 14324]